MAAVWLRSCSSSCMMSAGWQSVLLYRGASSMIQCNTNVSKVWWKYKMFLQQTRCLFRNLQLLGDAEFPSTTGQSNVGFVSEEETDIANFLADEQIDELKASNIKERVLVLQPDFKWGRGRFLSKTVQHRADEAESLVHSISNWEVHEKLIEPMHGLNSKHFFGTGKMKMLQKRVTTSKELNHLSAVFINTGKLSKKQTSVLESMFGCRVYDRYRIVLEIFKERAKTKEAKLQVKLAELQYLRWHLTSDHRSFDQQRGGTMTVGGGGETNLELKRRLISEKETKIHKELSHINNQRMQNRSERINKHVPQIALIGYTNAGKTTLARAMSGNLKLEPEDKLFATLDTTAHRGKLPCGINSVCIDTVGFITDLPHELIQSFSSTLKDVKDATLLVHVRDMAHPERDLQKKSVLAVLGNLKVDERLMENMIEVHNKEDERSFSEEEIRKYEAEIDGNELIVSVSALKKTGIEDLMLLIEKKIFDITGRRVFSLRVSQEGPYISWLHQHSTILNMSTVEGDQLEVQAVMDSSEYAKWQNLMKTH